MIYDLRLTIDALASGTGVPPVRINCSDTLETNGRDARATMKCKPLFKA